MCLQAASSCNETCYNIDMTKDYISQARAVIAIEQTALEQISNQLDTGFNAAVEAILDCKGRVIVTGMGKSGHIARKIAATLASTGTPAFFVHPAEAAHGDLGMMLSQDVVLALSHSGESDEVVKLLPALKRKGVILIAMSGRRGSSLAQAADIFLNAAVNKEACPLGLAPTSSTTAALALGDALAVVLLQARHFTPDDFALSHPAGSLGKRLLIRVGDLMHSGDALPQVSQDADLKAAILEMSAKGLGMTAVVDTEQKALGVITDGDLRRILQASDHINGIAVTSVMGTQPKTIHANKLASEALHVMQTKRVSGLLVVDDEQHLIGALHMHDLLKAGIV